jgi:DNA modification methylase
MKYKCDCGHEFEYTEADIKSHRLMVGDSTKIEDVEKLMDGKKADMVFTDPPYGIGKEIINDNLKKEDWLKLYEGFTNNMLAYLKENGYFYVWGYFETLSDYWQEIIKKRGDCNFRNFIIWKKSFIQGLKSGEFRQFPEHYGACLLCIYGQPFQNGPWSTSPNAEFYWEGFEPIRKYLDDERKKMGWDIPTMKKIVGHSDLLRDHWVSKSQWSFPTREVYEKFQEMAKQNAFRRDYDELRRDYNELRGYHNNSFGWTDIWEFDSLTVIAEHPTVKPIEVCQRGIKTNSREGELVLDLFGGSGSTLIACEQTNRVCYMSELDEHYVDVIRKRYWKFTHNNNEEGWQEGTKAV